MIDLIFAILIVCGHPQTRVEYCIPLVDETGRPTKTLCVTLPHKNDCRKV